MSEKMGGPSLVCVIFKEYSNWSNIYLAKAIALYALNAPSEMKKALKMACGLGNHQACDDLQHLKKVHNLDFAP